MFRMIDEHGPDKLEIQHFFEVYKAPEPGKSVQGGTSWVGRAAAEAEIEESRRRLAEHEGDRL